MESNNETPTTLGGRGAQLAAVMPSVRYPAGNVLFAPVTEAENPRRSCQKCWDLAGERFGNEKERGDEYLRLLADPACLTDHNEPSLIAQAALGW